MADRFCISCGSPLQPGAKICPRCGRVVSSAAPASAQMRLGARTGSSVRYGNPPPGIEAQRRNKSMAAQPERKKSVRRREKKKTAAALSGVKKGFRILSRTIIVMVLLVVVYIGIYLIQTTRVKIANYDFESNMLMSSDNYGQAFDSYFEEGSWSVNVFTGKVVYEGTSKHSENIKITFTVRLKVELKSIVVDNIEVDEEYFDTKMMAMYI